MNHLFLPVKQNVTSYLHHFLWAKIANSPRCKISNETANAFETKTGSGTNLKLTDLKMKQKVKVINIKEQQIEIAKNG